MENTDRFYVGLNSESKESFKQRKQLSNPITDKIIHNFKLEYLIFALKRCPEDMRLEIFSNFCLGCGSDNPKCNCMNED